MQNVSEYMLVLALCLVESSAATYGMAERGLDRAENFLWT